MSQQLFLKSGTLVLILCALAGCSSHSGNNAAPSPPAVVTPQSFESHFGTSFATAFDTDANGNAIDPTSADVPPLNLSAEPIDN